MTYKHYDLIIIGAGSGGLSLAAGAAMLDVKVALIESGKMGGDCLNYGCIPSKALLAAAKAAYHAHHTSQFGINVSGVEVNFNKVMQYVAGVIKHIEPHDSIERFTKLGVDVYQDHAEFINHTTIQSGKKKLSARRIVVATGSTAFVPPITGLSDVEYLTNETIFNLKELPEHLVVIGGGPIGCELAQAFRFLGSNVTILEAFKMMPHDEPELVEKMRTIFLSQKIELFEGIQIKHISEINGQIEIEFEDAGYIKKVSGTSLLVATGRRPKVHNLKLEKAGIAFTEKGIAVNQYLQTSNKKVYAIGDVAGSYQFTHVANYHAGIALKNILFRLPVKVDYTALPWVTYTYPELAHAGMTLKLAKERGIEHALLELDLSEIDRAYTDGTTSGRILVITTPRGRVLGVSIMAPNAGELITPWIMLIREKKTLRSFTDVMIPYPAMSELSKRVASQFYLKKLFSPFVKKLVKILQYFG